jgi:hypothetical protein
MNRFFGRELYIRLASDEGAFVCTTKYGKFYSQAKKFLLHELAPWAAHESEPAPVRKIRRTEPLSLLQQDIDASDGE